MITTTGYLEYRCLEDYSNVHSKTCSSSPINQHLCWVNETNTTSEGKQGRKTPPLYVAYFGSASHGRRLGAEFGGREKIKTFGGTNFRVTFKEIISVFDAENSDDFFLLVIDLMTVFCLYCLKSDTQS